MRSGFDNYQAFFSDLVKTIESAKSNWEPSVTRLILLGREEYVELTQIIMEDAGSHVEKLRLEYLDEERATKLVLAYAEKEAKGSFHEKPSRKAVSAFFDAAARALELERHELWSNPVGRGFAGYPPVLCAVANVISPNPAVALADWETPQEWRNAWQLLSETAERLLKREREKLQAALQSELPEVYCFS